MSSYTKPLPATWTALDDDQRSALAVDEVQPSFACYPGSPEEAAAAVAQAAEEGLSVVPRGAGSLIRLGFPPSRADIVLGTTNLDRVVAYEPADLTVTVEAGIGIGELQRVLNAEGQFLPLDPPVPPEATLGGIVAANASGPLRFAHGTVRDLVIGTRVVSADGQLTRSGGRVVKNVAGYDLNKLYAGSLGTLGVLVELSLRLAPLPDYSATLVARFDRWESAAQAVGRIVRSPLNPQCVELLDSQAATAAGLDTSEGAWSMLLRAAGVGRAVARQLRDLGALCREHGAKVTETFIEDDPLWDGIRNLTRAADGIVMAKVSVPIAETTRAQASIRELAAGEGLAAVTSSHAGNGVIYARLDVSKPYDALPDATLRFLSAGRSLAATRGGSLVLETAPTALKQTFDVWGDVGPGLRVMAALKRELDPKGILNPGRFVGRL